MRISKTKVNELREQKGYNTNTALAEEMGITKNQLSAMLSDKYNPLKMKVQILCEKLGVDFEAIIETTYNTTVNSGTNPEKPYKCIELFAGAGGLALGMDQAGFDHVLLVEFDKDCCETLKKNRPEWNVLCGDVHKVDFTGYEGNVDVVTGGFPCQAFSYAGKKLGFEDTRGTLFHEYARCIKEVKPKMFLAENVRGLVSHDNGRTLQTILDVFASLGYQVKYQVLNACYYGVPQKRERIVIIGIRNDLKDMMEFNYPVADKEWTTLRKGLDGCPKSIGQSYSDRKKAVLDLVPPGGCWVDLPEEIAKEYMGKSYYSGGGKRGMARRIAWDEPCLTLTCSPSQKQTERCHPDETRPFTVREYARIQSFPDDWDFCGGVGSQYKQIGNAVPVEMARRIGVNLVQSLQCLGQEPQ